MIERLQAFSVPLDPEREGIDRNRKYDPGGGAQGAATASTLGRNDPVVLVRNGPHPDRVFLGEIGIKIERSSLLSLPGRGRRSSNDEHEVGWGEAAGPTLEGCVGRDGDSGVLDAAGVPEFDVAPSTPHHPRLRRAWAVARVSSTPWASPIIETRGDTPMSLVWLWVCHLGYRQAERGSSLAVHRISGGIWYTRSTAQGDRASTSGT